jgi:hypothetical protein
VTGDVTWDEAYFLLTHVLADALEQGEGLDALFRCYSARRGGRGRDPVDDDVDAFLDDYAFAIFAFWAQVGRNTESSP